MAEFVTKKENMRRLAIIIICVLVDAIALAFGIYALKETNFLEKKPENPNNIEVLRKKVAEQRRNNQEILEKLLKYGAVVGWKVDPSGSIDRFTSQPLEVAAMKNFLSDFARPQKERRDKGEKSLFEQISIGGYKRWDEQGAEKNLLLTELFEELIKKENEFKTKIGDLESQIKAERDKEKQIKDQTEQENKQAQNELDGGVQPNQPAAGHIGDLIRLMKEINQLQKTHATELEQLEKEAIDAQNKSTETKNEIVRKRAALEAVKADLKQRIYEIQYKRLEEIDLKRPDGRILGLDEKRQLAYIDNLRRDRLFKGTRFTVFSMEKGGEKLDKGQVEVMEVREESSSICAVLSVKNPDFPLKVGDYIYNELYERDRTRRIAFAGRFTGKLSNDEAATLIRNFGDVYEDRVTKATNYVVVAEGYEEHPNHKAALEYGIKILREKILYDYLGVKRD